MSRGLGLLVAFTLLGMLMIPAIRSHGTEVGGDSAVGQVRCPLKDSGDPPSPHSHSPFQDAVLLIDSSGSMTTNDPMNCRIDAARTYINGLTPADHVSVLDFDASCRWTGPDHHLDSPGHDGAPDYTDPWTDVGQIDSTGGTNLLCPITEATNELVSLGDPTHMAIAILLTDGVDSSGNTNAQILAAAQDASLAGITIFTVGFGSADAALLEEIARVTGGRFYWATDCTDIGNAFQSTFTAVSGSGDAPPAAAWPATAMLSGNDVALSWALSPDDGGGTNDVRMYEIWYGLGAYDETRDSYGLLATVPRGSAGYVHLGGNATTGIDYYYDIRVVDYAGHRTWAPQQVARVDGSFAPGRYLVALWLDPSDHRTESVLQTLPWTSVAAYSDGAWSTRHAGRPGPEVTTLELGQGYWIDTPGGWLVVAGVVPLTIQVTLRAGWNLVGASVWTNRPLADALAGVPYSTVEAYSYTGPYHLRGTDSSDGFVHGRAYWVLMTSDAVLTLW